MDEQFVVLKFRCPALPPLAAFWLRLSFPLSWKRESPLSFKYVFFYWLAFDYIHPTRRETFIFPERLMHSWHSCKIDLRKILFCNFQQTYCHTKYNSYYIFEYCVYTATHSSGYCHVFVIFTGCVIVTNPIVKKKKVSLCFDDYTRAVTRTHWHGYNYFSGKTGQHE